MTEPEYPKKSTTIIGATATAEAAGKTPAEKPKEDCKDE